MTKEWKTLPTINDTTKTKETLTSAKHFKSMMDKVVVYTGNEDEIKKKVKEHQDKLFAAQEEEEAKLLDAFTNKKLKSKAAIKRARALAKRKSDAGKKNKKAVDPQVNSTVEGQPDIDSSRANAEA